MPKYSLDLAFSSTTQPFEEGQPILALAYGFSEFEDDSAWGERGQSTLRIERNSQFRFTVFDTANPKSPQVESIKVDFANGNTPFRDPGDDRRIRNPIVATDLQSQLGQSAGCNVKGLYSITAEYTVDGDIADDTQFPCTVTVTTLDNREFVVDPEMQVEGGG